MSPHSRNIGVSYSAATPCPFCSTGSSPLARKNAYNSAKTWFILRFFRSMPSTAVTHCSNRFSGGRSSSGRKLSPWYTMPVTVWHRAMRNTLLQLASDVRNKEMSSGHLSHMPACNKASNISLSLFTRQSIRILSIPTVDVPHRSRRCPCQRRILRTTCRPAPRARRRGVQVASIAARQFH